MLYLNLRLIRLKTEEMNMQPVLIFFTILCLWNDSACWGFKLTSFPSSRENLTVETSQIPEDIIATGSLIIHDVILPAINIGGDNYNQKDEIRISSEEVARNTRGQYEEVKDDAPKIIKLLTTSDVRVKRSTAIESPRDVEMMEDVAVNVTSDSSTNGGDFTEADGLSQNVGETNSTSGNPNLFSTKLTNTQSENISENLTTSSPMITTETTTEQPVNQTNSESNQYNCPLWVSPAISGVVTGTKIYGLPEKPCGDNKPFKYEQDYVGFILQRTEELLYHCVNFTSHLLSKIIIRDDSLLTKLKKVDFKCFAPKNMPENETSAENRTMNLHNSLLKSNALLDLAIKKGYQNETTGGVPLRSDQLDIIVEVEKLRENVKSLLCGIEKLIANKGIDIVNFPLFSGQEDGAFPQLSFNLYMGIHVNQVYNFLSDFANHETNGLWSFFYAEN